MEGSMGVELRMSARTRLRALQPNSDVARSMNQL